MIFTTEDIFSLPECFRGTVSELEKALSSIRHATSKSYCILFLFVFTEKLFYLLHRRTGNFLPGKAASHLPKKLIKHVKRILPKFLLLPKKI